AILSLRWNEHGGSGRIVHVKGEDKMTKWLQAITCALALLVCFALPVQAQDRHGRKYRHGRRVFVTRHWNSANPTPGIPRRVRRGRNLTPGIPRGPVVRRTTIRN